MAKRRKLVDPDMMNLETVHRHEGLSADFAARMRMLVADCRIRPGNEKARKLIVQIELFPNPEDVDRVLCVAKVNIKLPAAEFEPISLIRTQDDQLMFDFDEEGGESE